MRIIVFDRELHEPLTVVDIPHWLAEQAKSGQRIKLLPPQKLDPRALFHEEPTEMVQMQIVTLTFERVMRGDSRNGGAELLFWYAYADDPETALLLRCAYLPGQIGDVQRRQKAAFFEGLLTGF